jgi:hypothetical protein
MSRLTTALFVVLLIAVNRPDPANAQPTDSLKTLLRFHRCPLSPYLQAVYERPAAIAERDRFLKLSVRDRPRNYVRCQFADDRKKLYCEASSYIDAGPSALSLSLPPEALASLAKLGFKTDDAKNNFPYERALEGTPDFDAIATMMLTALHDAYGVREETELKTYAPFAGDIVTACLR